MVRPARRRNRRTFWPGGALFHVSDSLSALVEWLFVWVGLAESSPTASLVKRAIVALFRDSPQFPQTYPQDPEIDEVINFTHVKFKPVWQAALRVKVIPPSWGEER